MKRLSNRIIIIFFLTNVLFAKVVTADAKDVELIDIVNQQTMLSQQIAKAYLCIVNKIGIDDAKREMTIALRNFKKTSKKANSLTKSPKVINFINRSNRFSGLSKKPFSQKSAKSILHLSELVLGSSKSVASLFKKGLKKDAFESISIAGQQQMLAQRIAKYYIAYKSNISGSKEKLIESINLFGHNHKKLMNNRANTKTIKRKLKEIDRLWAISNKLYSGRELPKIVLDTTDDISKKMNKVTKLYIAKYK